METIKKRISDLDAASQPLGGTELAEISQGGVSKKVTLTNIFGSGWWAALRAAFSSFVAPEATHAVDSDMLDGESAPDFHDAAQLVGAAPLASIPAELTGKNAATATKLATSRNINGVAFDGSASISTLGGYYAFSSGTYGAIYGQVGLLINKTTGATSILNLEGSAPPNDNFTVPSGYICLVIKTQ